MGITSFWFLCFFALVLLVYYIVPKKVQWITLLAADIIFFLSFGTPWLLLYPLATITVAYFGAKKMEQEKEPVKRKRVLSLVVALNLSVLVILKYLNLGVYTYNAIALRLGNDSALLKTLYFLIPLGISFYTLSVLSYVFDVYYETGSAEKNWAKLLHFSLYFPLLISGPIVRYKEQREELFSNHSFDYNQITRGMQRMLWGFFKVLVISERLSKVVNTVYGDYETYGGFYILVAMVCFSFQLYSNFSGSMDIVNGVSECFGIHLPENFQTPYFSKTIQEFWRRWHITLGTWLRDYVFYPVLRTEFFMKLPKKLKDKMGKKKAKQITTFLAMFILWFGVGLWHGGAWKYIIGSGILQWLYIVSGELLEPVWVKMRSFFRVKEKTTWFRGFQILRTFMLMSFAFLFFQAPSFTSACEMIGSIFTTWNPAILWNGSLFAAGLGFVDWMIVIFSLLILYIVDFMKLKMDVREWVASRPLVIRWIIFYALIFYVILLGNYGPGYSAAEFIYQGF